MPGAVPITWWMSAGELERFAIVEAIKSHNELLDESKHDD